MPSTSNMTGSISMRFRHQQHQAMLSYIKELTPEQLEKLISTDRGRRLHTVFKRQGRDPDALQTIVRLAVDEWLDKHANTNLTNEKSDQ